MTSSSLVITIPFAVIMVLSAASDLYSRRIPNVLTVSGTLAAPVLWLLLGGPTMAWASIVGAGFGLLVGVPLFALGALGGGDAKLLVATGAFLGPARLVSALIVMGIAGGVLALFVAVGRGQLRPTLIGAWNLALRLATLGRRGTARSIESQGAITIPYGVVIAVGGLMSWFALTPGLIAR
jgi:prepilin peptidase CpaA